jgi:hypothetical protein
MKIIGNRKLGGSALQSNYVFQNVIGTDKCTEEQEKVIVRQRVATCCNPRLVSVDLVHKICNIFL